MKQNWAKWLGTLFFIAISLLGCSNQKDTNPFYSSTFLPPPADSLSLNIPVKEQRPVAYFTTLKIFGDMNVNLKANQRQPSLLLTGDSRDLAHVKSAVTADDTLSIRVDRGYPKYGQIHADISTEYLNSLILKNFSGRLKSAPLNTPYFNASIDGSGSVSLSGKIGLHRLNLSGSSVTTIEGINSRLLKITMQDNPTAVITGFARLKSLKAEGSGHLKLYWVDSPELHVVQTGKTQVELAGVSDKLYVTLSRQALFNGRYLRAKEGYIKTTDHSIAEVQLLKTQAALARGNSTISYYNYPKNSPLKSNFMGNNGAVLDMNDH